MDDNRSRQRIWLSMQSTHPKYPEVPLASALLALLSLSGLLLCSMLAVSGTVTGTDLAVQSVVQGTRQIFLDEPMIAITLLGDTVFIMGAALILAGGLAWSNHRAAAWHLLIAVAVGQFGTETLKYFLDVARPESGITMWSKAFPSGHAGASTLLYGLTAAYVAQDYPPYRRGRIYAVAAIPIGIVAFSRLYLNVHWLSDVIGGVLFGLLLCAVTRISYSRFNGTGLMQPGFLKKLGVAWLVWYLVYALYRFQGAVQQYSVPGH